MTTDLIVPGIGEIIALDAATDVLADAFTRIADLERDLRDTRAAITAELLDRLDVENKRTVEIGGWRLEAERADQRDYDPDELAVVLARLVSEDKISVAAMEDALARKVTRVPRKRELTRLLGSDKLTDADREDVAACAHPVTRARKLTITAARA